MTRVLSTCVYTCDWHNRSLAQGNRIILASIRFVACLVAVGLSTVRFVQSLDTVETFARYFPFKKRATAQWDERSLCWWERSIHSTPPYLCIIVQMQMIVYYTIG